MVTWIKLTAPALLLLAGMLFGGPVTAQDQRWVAKVPVVEKGEAVGKLVYTRMTFPDEDACKNFITTDDFKSTLPAALAAAQEDDPDATIGDPICEVVQ